MVGYQTTDAADCAERIRASNRVVALTGAGVSTAAGLPDFRGPNGLYVTRRYDPETVFDIDAFRRNPVPFYDFTRDFLGSVHTLQPTLTHRFLADLEGRGKLTAVVTQNIDSLHQKAGSRNVVAIHGDYWTSHCLYCHAEFNLEYLARAVVEEEVPHCPCSGLIKPDVVFFGEPVCSFDRASAVVAESDYLLVLGSSLNVYPAALLPDLAGGDVLVVNQGEVGLPPLPHRSLVDADLDEFFGEVSGLYKPTCS
ncbi:MAG: Sir2 family NAD-dependent protein deacetylase [Acidobacteriota bacterium]|nr:Sir2 family NAD-dependent protein deacetylase [Acidobacteriota bacterium]